MNDTADTLASLAEVVRELLVQEPFYAHVIMRMQREVTDEVQTAAVTVRAGTVHLLVNAGFWLRTLRSDEHRCGVLKHEVLHVVLGHLQRGHDFPDKDRLNVAADLAVNSLIDERQLPTGALLCHTPGLLQPADRVVGQSLDWYYPRLDAEAARATGAGGAGQRGEGAAVWQEIEPGSAGAAMQDLVRRGAQACDAGALHRLAGGLRQAIEQAIAPPVTVDWRRALRMFGAGSQRTFIRNTLKRPSRRFGRVPGIRVVPRTHLAVVIDTSASIESQQLARFFSELRGVWRTGATVTVIECDDSIGRVWTYRGQAAAACSGGGGTDFDPALKWVNERAARIDGVIFMTDGEGQRSLDCRRRILWLVTGENDLADLRAQIGRPGEAMVRMVG